MKESRIYLKAWMDAHARKRATDTDGWYVELANRLLPLSSRRLAEPVSWSPIALRLALYMEDCVANAGGWRQFIHWHKECYGRYLPFYALGEGYYPDEINREDVAFLLWDMCALDEEKDSVLSPLDPGLWEWADSVYQLLDTLFEEAPIADAPTLSSYWVMPKEEMLKGRTPLPTILPDTKLPIDTKRFLEASGGEALLFFGSYDDLRRFFVETLKWGNGDDGLLPELKHSLDFVLYANPKGVLVAPDVAPYFADKRNPLYNADIAAKEAYAMFVTQGFCPFDLLKYGMEHGLLTDAAFPFEHGRELLRDNWDFVARRFLGEYYEGD
ncbi:MAG: DUF3843 family protein [Mediterranea sp.]|jgi:hypothetical protein|nr:DUF3843 family protein [Mediterranea sp.]